MASAQDTRAPRPIPEGEEVRQPGGDADDRSPSTKIHPIAYAGYYGALFFAHWFGSSRFDMDNDGKFDPSDVEAFLKDKGVLAHHFHNPKARAVVRQKHKERHQARVEVKAQAVAKVRSLTVTPGTADGSKVQVTVRGLDRDGDGDVDLADFLDAKVEGEAEEDIIYDHLMVKQIPPVFIIAQVSICLLLWFIGALVYASKYDLDWLTAKGGLDTLGDDDGNFDLRWSNANCENLGYQVWRWFSYQFTHVGLAHVGMNSLLNIIMGIPLEGVHGAWRLCLMFNVGVFGGAMCYYISDGHRAVVGCSGGCYALIGIHIADLIMNWSQKKFRYPVLFFLIFLIGLDVINTVVSGSSSTSHAAHVGGAAAGVAIGVVVCKNLQVKKFERAIQWFLAGWGLFFTVFAIAWIGLQTDGPRNIWEAMRGEDGYCAVVQFWDSSISRTSLLCTRCGTEQCLADIRSKYEDCCAEAMAGCTCYQAQAQSESVCDEYAQWI